MAHAALSQQIIFEPSSSFRHEQNSSGSSSFTGASESVSIRTTMLLARVLASALPGWCPERVAAIAAFDDTGAMNSTRSRSSGDSGVRLTIASRASFTWACSAGESAATPSTDDALNAQPVGLP